jgi:hypothetical protein
MPATEHAESEVGVISTSRIIGPTTGAKTVGRRRVLVRLGLSGCAACASLSAELTSVPGERPGTTTWDAPGNGGRQEREEGLDASRNDGFRGQVRRWRAGGGSGAAGADRTRGLGLAYCERASSRGWASENLGTSRLLGKEAIRRRVRRRWVGDASDFGWS